MQLFSATGRAGKLAGAHFISIEDIYSRLGAGSSAIPKFGLRVLLTDVEMEHMIIARSAIGCPSRQVLCPLHFIWPECEAYQRSPKRPAR